ncbi:MAG: YecR family lipoprotein [Reyranellaceae bacterium]
MRVSRWGPAMVAAAMLAGCTVQKELVPMGGSRADGTVVLAYEIGAYATAQVDYAAGHEAARRTCAGWGYAGAEPFGGSTERCVAVNGYGQCLRWRISVPYQCTGTPAGR